MNDPISYEDYLDRFGELTYTNVGASMLPLLRQGKDLFTVIKKGPERCSRGDVVLYHVPQGKYILHRIVEVLPDSYVLLGDNCITKETGIRDEDILGVMTAFVRGGKQFHVRDRSYRIYTALILALNPGRIICKKMMWMVRRALGKLLRRRFHEG